MGLFLASVLRSVDMPADNPCTPVHTQRCAFAAQRARMLNRLSKDTLDRWAPFLAPVDLPVGAVLQSAGKPIHDVYFPQDAVVAQLPEVAPGLQMAAFLVGADGVVGIAGVLTAEPAHHECVVVKPGRMLRLGVEHLRAEMDRDAPTRRLVLAYVQSLIVQTAQAVLCSRFHDVEQHLCTRLSQLLLEGQAEPLRLTQELLARVVGARRERVNQIVRSLQAAGIVRSGRAWLSVSDRPGLLRRACDCHRVLAQERAKFMGPV